MWWKGVAVEGQERAEDRLIRRLELAAQLLGVGYSLWMVWTLIPEHRQRALLMRAMAAIRSSAARAACLTGAQAISLEARTGCENYVVPYGFSLIRDKAAAWYEKGRYSS